MSARRVSGPSRVRALCSLLLRTLDSDVYSELITIRSVDMGDDQMDPGFAALPLTLQKRIDAAFDSALGRNGSDKEPARKRRKLEHSLQPGGFISEDPAPGGFIAEESAAGGFIVDESSEGGFVRDSSSPPQGGGFVDDDQADAGQLIHIPLSAIPTALQSLDLPPDDEDVLSVFRNAASGWGERRRTASHRDEDPEEAFVSRKDWRAVCAALLDPSAADEEDVDMEDVPADGQVEEKVSLEETPSNSGEEYVESGGAESDAEEGDDSDDEYREGSGGFVRQKKAKSGTATNKSRKGRKARATTESDEEDEGRRDLTARQKEECRAAFALFFPDVTDEELDKQRIRIKDITRVAKLLKEKITAEETLEMLEAFSSAPDKSMSLPDFERMMVAAKLVVSIDKYRRVSKGNICSDIAVLCDNIEVDAGCHLKRGRGCKLSLDLFTPGPSYCSMSTWTRPHAGNASWKLRDGCNKLQNRRAHCHFEPEPTTGKLRTGQERGLTPTLLSPPSPE
ncbi:hypothetical protein NUW54_g7110 [Trametes sanguinea]|uniref:Uncharacterized protein n=1 Tax=Trametes sanguinea TaxID=158606 RepID=A0ACC1PQD3_9APHY|nr:hypothetical protein NUW54_g7110 [Trametes sanguinea]